MRQHRLDAFAQFHKRLFAAHFAVGEDLEDQAVLDRHAQGSGLDPAVLDAALAADPEMSDVTAAEMVADGYGVRGTPAWLLSDQLIAGLRSVAEFEQLATDAVRLQR